jgi:hypothetical protein
MRDEPTFFYLSFFFRFRLAPPVKTKERYMRNLGGFMQGAVALGGCIGLYTMIVCLVELFNG